MVTRSPIRASVSSGASGAGARRTGACASITSYSSPSTKRAASTLPARCLAARSGRAGVMRGSKVIITPQPDYSAETRRNGERMAERSLAAIAFLEQGIERARRLALAAVRPRRLRRLCPAIDVEMRPGPGGRDEAVEEQRGRDRAGKAAADIVDVGGFGIEHAFIRSPQRHAPDRIVLSARMVREVGRECIVAGIERRQILTERDT